MTDIEIAVGCGSDFALAAIPWFYISKLHIKRREKAAIGVALSVGFFVSPASVPFLTHH